MPELLPPAIRSELAAGRPVEAGLALLRHAEAMARAEPGRSHRWAKGLASASFDDPLVQGCARWAAGVALYLSGDSASAEAPLIQGAEALKRAGRPDLADRARLLLIDLHGERFQIGQARRLGRRLFESFQRRGDSERQAAALINLACAEDAVDRVSRARELWRRARRQLEPACFRRLLAEGNLANVAVLEGQYEEAATVLRTLAEQAREQGYHGLERHAELNLAECEFASGEVDRALSRWEDLILRAREAGDLGVAVAAELDRATAELSLGNSGPVRRRLPKVLDQAQALGLEREVARALRLQLVLEAEARGPGAFRNAVASIGERISPRQRDLLLVEYAQMDPAVPPGEISRAARRLISSGFLFRGHQGLAWAARRYLDRGNTRRARSLARETLASRRSSPWIRMTAHHVMGRLGGPRALRHLMAAGREADRLHGRLASAMDRQAFLVARGEVYLDLLAALLERNRPEDRRRALAVAGNLRTGWVLDELARRSDRGDDPAVTRWQELRCRLASLLANAEGDGEARLRRSGLKIQGRIRDLEQEIQDLETQLARRWPPATAARGDGLARELLELLPPDDTFVEYFLDRRDLFTFVGARGRLTVRRHGGAAEELHELIASVRFHMDVAARLGKPARMSSKAALAERLRRIGEILQIPEPAAEGGRLWIAPHDGLFHLPWPAVRDIGGRELIDGPAFALLPGAAAAVTVLREAPWRPQDAALSASPSEHLPLIEREIAALETVVPNARVVSTAGREEFLGLLKDHELVHLAGHAIFLDGLPQASGLRMGDGYVSVHDLAATRMKARFVSFGVCSGLRLATENGDRYAGFLLALMAGGVRSVAGPISPVDDRVAYTFDLSLHRELVASGDPARAYRSAVESVREMDTNPAIWGNFHLYGDNRLWMEP